MTFRERPVKVLHVIPSVSKGGIESLVLELARHLDPSQFRLELAVLNPSSPVHLDTFKGLGIPVHFVSDAGSASSLWAKLGWRIAALRGVWHLLRRGQFDVLHCHMGIEHAGYSLAALIHRVPVRIVHAHRAAAPRETATQRWGRRLWMGLSARGLVTHRVGCGRAAADWLWGPGQVSRGRAIVIYNGVDLSRFEQLRLRRVGRTHSNDGVRLVHVGRFTEQKNQFFLLDVMRALVQVDPTARLDIAGFGPLESRLREYATALGLEEHIRFLGADHPVDSLLADADLFVLPSLFEGLPIVAIECQAAGVRLVASDDVTDEVDLGAAVFLPRDSGSSVWADSILGQKRLSRRMEATLSSERLANFDIREIAQQWAEVYSVRPS